MEMDDIQVGHLFKKAKELLQHFVNEMYYLYREKVIG